MGQPKYGSKACHNCRRQRLKCDQSLPRCLKCIKRGQECLGYERLLRWEPGIASRGKMIGRTFGEMSESPARHTSSPTITPAGLPTPPFSRASTDIASPRPLLDPLLQDVSHVSRRYLSYFASDVCRDLVLYDTPKHNPFRELIPLTRENPVLLHIIIASSALRMSNASQKSAVLHPAAAHRHRSSLPSSPSSSSSDMQVPESYKDALAAKQRALYLLNSALNNLASVDIDVTLAVVLLFIEFELLDSGRDNWRHHINGARAIIKTLCGPNITTPVAMTPLRSCLISNCLVFDIFGSTLACSMGIMPSDMFSTEAASLLHDAEGNHCTSFPVILLQLIRVGAQLLQPNTSFAIHPTTESKQKQAVLLLENAQFFDSLAWATALQPRSPAADIQHRTYIASAHRAASCIYLSRICLALDHSASLPCDLESLVAEIVTHLSLIHPDDALFTATAWPAFIAGAETTDHTTQQWVARRFHELWEVEPWGLIRGALGVLENIWASRSSRSTGGNRALSHDKKADVDGDWLADLRGRDVDWLII